MSAEIVAQAKADLLAAGKDLSGNNGAFLITMEAAYRLGLGVVDKPNGNHAEYPVGSGHFFSVDGIMDRAGNFFDVLIDGGEANGPTWQSNGTVDPSRFRPAVAVLTPFEIPPVVDHQPPDPGIPDLTPAYLATRIDDLEDAIGRVEGLLADLRLQSDANTEKIQQQIDQVVKNAEASIKAALPQILGAGGGGILGGLFGRR